MAKVYEFLFILIFWSPLMWKTIGPKNGVIDNGAHWFHRHAVFVLNRARSRRVGGWVLFRFAGVKIRDPHSHPSHIKYSWSKLHLFVT